MVRLSMVAFLVGCLALAAPAAAQTEDLRKAAEAGNAEAQFTLGVAYMNGERGLAKDERQAVVWVRKAAQQGHAKAQHAAGAAAFNGWGGALDQKEAERWWQAAAQQGYAPSTVALAGLYERGVPQRMADAIRLLEQAAAAGYSQAQVNLGNHYFTGNGVEKNPRMAEELWLKAAAQNSGRAMFNLGTLYEGNALGRTDLARAESWFAKAAAAGERGAEERAAALRQMRSEGRTEKTDTDIRPPPGPTQTYKGKTLVGSTYPGADNEAFFLMVKQGLDMTEKLPAKYREDIKLIREVIYDPPSPHRKASGPITNTPCVYTVGSDFMKTAPVIVYRDMKFSSGLQFVEAFAGTGGLARKHHEAMAVKRKMASLEAGGGKGSADYASLRQKHDTFMSGLQKANLDQAQQDNCEAMRLKFEIYKQFESDPRRQDAVAKRISSLNCW
jgi:TPR repeat protein